MFVRPFEHPFCAFIKIMDNVNNAAFFKNYPVEKKIFDQWRAKHYSLFSQGLLLLRKNKW
jgi:hypothetical protein